MLCIVGLKATGKTTLGRLLSRRWSCPWYDTDQAMLAEGQRFHRIAALHKHLGEQAFRRLEHDVVMRVLERAYSEQAMVSCGGGLALDGTACAWMMEHAHVVVLHAQLQDWYDLLTQRRQRAFLGHELVQGVQAPDWARAYHAARSPVYQAMSDTLMDIEGQCPEEVLAILLKRLPRTLVRFMDRRRESGL